VRRLVFLIAALGCSKAKTPAAPPPDEPVASSEEASAPEPPPPPPKPKPVIKANLRCAKVVTAAMKDKYFKNATEKEDQGAGPTSVNCNYYTKDPSQEPFSVSVLCPNWLESQFQTALDAGRSAMKDAKGVRIGRLGYVAGDDASAEVWDDDTMCLITIAAPKAGELAKDLAAAINPSSIQ
jgi:hypothetical protein